MWARLRLDIAWSDLAFGFAQLLASRAGASLCRRIEDRWPARGQALVCLSVRSGFDLLLGALRLPAGSEILFSALNIPDMVRIAEHHGLVPVPVDLNLARLAPDPDRLARAVTPATRAIVVAHLYGGRAPLEPILDVARLHSLLVIEDCAQAFDGSHAGHPDADVALFSFGPIKTATALAGAVVLVRDPGLMAKMRAEHDRWPVQSRWDYCKRLCKYSLLKLLSSRPAFAAVVALGRLTVGDVDGWMHAVAKSFRGSQLFARLRRQPGAALLAVLERRLRTFNLARIARRASNGRLLARLLSPIAFCPGTAAAPHSFWLFPVMPDDPAAAVAGLARAGFDATQARRMTAIDPPAGRPELEPAAAREALTRMVFLPCYPEMPEAELERMAGVLVQLSPQAMPTLRIAAKGVGHA